VVKPSSFFEEVKTDDLPKLNSDQVDRKACCVTKQLAYELFRFASQQQGFPFNDPELMKRCQDEQLNVYQMRPYNEMAIKIMRKFKRLKEEDDKENE
jgi:hypothetical protein